MDSLPQRSSLEPQVTPQALMKEKLESLPIPRKEIKVYGSQIMITCHSRSSAEKWHRVLYGLSPVNLRMGESLDYAKKNKGTCLNPTTVKVWRVWASL